MIVLGTRPEAIKLAPVILELKKQSEIIQTIVVSTGQHKEQLKQVLDDFVLEVDIDLHIMKKEQSLFYVFTKIIENLEGVFEKEKPDMVLVHGDTQTTISAAIAACYKKIPIGHIEAGLRTFKKDNPWPEEINRIVTDSIADLFFAPTSLNRDNLLHIGVQKEKIFVTGQTQIDAITLMYEKICKNNGLNNYDNKELTKLPKEARILLVTVHRRENQGEKMRMIFGAIKQIAKEFYDVCIVYPVHLNPLVQTIANEELGGIERIILLHPLSYQDMVLMLEKSYLVMSDSGGIQEECPVFHKPLILLRETTERPEGIQAGTAILAGTKTEEIYTTAKKLLTDQTVYNRMAKAKNPFGDGRATKRIVAGILRYFGFQKEEIDEFKG